MSKYFLNAYNYVASAASSTTAGLVEKAFPAATSTTHLSKANDDFAKAQDGITGAGQNAGLLAADVVLGGGKIVATVGGSFGIFKSGAEINSALYTIELLASSTIAGIASTVRSAVLSGFSLALSHPLIVPAIGVVAGAVIAHEEIADGAKQTKNLFVNIGSAAKNTATYTSQSFVGYLLALKEYLNPDLQKGSVFTDEQIVELEKAYQSTTVSLSEKAESKEEGAIDKVVNFFQSFISKPDAQTSSTVTAQDELEDDWLSIEPIEGDWVEVEGIDYSDPEYWAPAEIDLAGQGAVAEVPVDA